MPMRGHHPQTTPPVCSQPESSNQKLKCMSGEGLCIVGGLAKNHRILFWGPAAITWPSASLSSLGKWIPEAEAPSTTASGSPGHLSAQVSGSEKQKSLQSNSTEIHRAPMFAPDADHMVIKKTSPGLVPRSSESSCMWMRQVGCWLFYRGRPMLCVSCKLNINSHHVLSMYCVSDTRLCNLHVTSHLWDMCT